ncbi:MAG: BamA/TamA family outer membrane protein [Cytophagaceae bacterium]
MRYSLVVIFSLTNLFVAFSQDSLKVIKSDSVPQTDLPELLFKKRIERKAAEKPDTTEDKVYWSVLPAMGSTPATGFAGIILVNAAFYTGDKSTTYMSSVTANLTLTAKSQIILPIRTNIWLKDNKWNFVGDWRFMKYPQATYGIGGNTPWEQEELIKYSYFKIQEYGYRNVYSKFFLGLGIHYDQFLKVRTSDYEQPGLGPFESYPYGTGNRSSAFGYSFAALWDDRKNVINPQQGGYAQISYRMNPSYLGNTYEYNILLIDLRKYFYIPAKKHKNILGFWAYYWGVTNGDTPYLLLPSNGWDSFASNARGFTQGRYRSRQMFTMEAEYRFRISKNGLLGGVLFTNASTFAEPNGEFKYVNPAVGTGLRIKLNKNSQTNITLDFAIGVKNNRGFYADVGEIF